SNRPNRIQVPLSTDIEPQLQLYKREVQALVPHLPVEPKMPDSGVESNIWSTFNLASRISESPHKVLLKITNSYDRGHYSFEFLVANEQGTILDRSYINLSPIENLASRVMAPPEPAPSDEQPIPLSDLSRSYMAALGFDRQSNSTPSPMAPQIRQFLLNPEKNEPGALVFTDLLFGLATLKNWDIVASHHPSAGYYNTFGANMSGAMPSRFLKALAGGWSEVSKVEQKDNWLTVADTDWFGVKSQVYDRAVLGRFVRAAASGATSIDDVAAFAVQTPYRNHFDYGQNLLRILNGNRAGGSDYYHYPLLRFHGSLTPPQKRQSLSEEGLVYSSLNPAQRQLFNTCILNNEGIHSYSQPKVENGQIVEDEFDNNSMRADPYEVYGNGFPADGQLKLTYLNEPMILAAMNRNGREVGNVLFNVSSLANHLFAKESGKMDALSEYSGYRCETREQYRYDIKGHPRLTHSGMLQRTLSTSEKVDSPEKLPPDIWKKVQDELRRYKESVTRRPPST
ncbi:MAG TPA: hypothetical protein PLX06_15010, partial [Fimbriimonadaceae bacterium]|nr:hypothetical protein [Fimbriimonadaceae bacterium]